MGKALVIDGLTVSNPLCVVTFTTEVDSLTIDKSSLSMTAGDTGTITATVVTSDGTPLLPSFTSSDSSVASVSVNGNTATVTAVGRGSATITVKAGSKTQTCSVAVAAAPAEELAAYYTANQTIASADRNALNTLVTGMSNAGLWAKVKRFYPMLGTSLSDLLLEVKSDSDKGFSDMSASLQASTNAVTNIANSGNLDSSSKDSANIAINDMAIVTLSDVTSGESRAYAAKFFGDSVSGRYFQHDVSSSAYKRITANISAVPNWNASYPNGQDIKDVVDRNTILSLSSTAANIFLNGTKLTSIEISNSTTEYLNTPMKFLGNGVGAIYKLLMITSGLTDSEAVALDGLLNTFYQATSKRSAS